jgi:hypothetical protein
MLRSERYIQCETVTCQSSVPLEFERGPILTTWEHTEALDSRGKPGRIAPMRWGTFIISVLGFAAADDRSDEQGSDVPGAHSVGRDGALALAAAGGTRPCWVPAGCCP